MTDSATPSDKPSSITYSGYLALDDLLAAQHPLSRLSLALRAQGLLLRHSDGR